MLITTLALITSTRNNLMSIIGIIDKYIHTMGYIHTMKYYMALKISKLKLHTTTWS